jgi:hypothetical protein
LYKNQILEILQNLDLSAQDFAIMQNNAGDIFEIPGEDADRLVTIQDMLDYLQEAGVED